MSKNISCCGADCGDCSFYGNPCMGCNEALGRVFHAPEGKECPIYYCCRVQNSFHSCGECEKLPCNVIMGTRDPNLSEDEFLQSVTDRVSRLKGGSADN